MTIEHAELGQMQRAYKAMVEEWIVAIRREETLASANHSVAEIDLWEQAHCDEEEARGKVKQAKSAYESALGKEFFDF